MDILQNYMFSKHVQTNLYDYKKICMAFQTSFNTSAKPEIWTAALYVLLVITVPESTISQSLNSSGNFFFKEGLDN